jgi:hypothetical protein
MAESQLVNNDQLTPGEPLSPELVLVLPPELRAEALARLGPPEWTMQRPSVGIATRPAADSLTRTLGAALLPRVAQLMLTFLVVTALTLSLSAVANAVRDAPGPSGSSERSAGVGHVSETLPCLFLQGLLAGAPRSSSTPACSWLKASPRSTRQ